MKSTYMTKVLAVAAIAVMAATVFVSVAAEPADAAEANPTIADSGFIKDKKAFFFYSKFATSGFAYTGGSISGDTPTKGVGTVMKDNSVFASITKLDKNVQYYLAIEEHDKSGALNYGVIVTLNSSIITSYVFMSVTDGQPYCDATALTAVAMSDCAKTSFTAEVTNDIYYAFRLTTDSTAKADDLANSKVENPLQFTKICALEVKTNDLILEVEDIGKNYGYTSEGKAQYAGAGLSYDLGTYLCGFFITNVDKDKLEINVDASSKFAVKNTSILYGKNVTMGYGYFVLSQADYPNEDFNKATVTIGENGQSYASESITVENNDSDEKDNKGVIMLVGLAVVFVAAILIGMAYTNNKKEE